MRVENVTLRRFDCFEETLGMKMENGRNEYVSKGLKKLQ